ncbi:MAG: tetratricopeptide repeat protein [Polyangiaceae bacterium]
MPRGYRRGLLVFATVSAIHAFAGVAYAQDAQDTAAAETLFDEARKLMADGKMDAACPKLEESERVAPAVGTLLNLGICYEQSHRPASAWATFKEAISAARANGQSEREQLARSHAQALEGKFSTLTVRVAPATRNISGVEVRRDGEIVARAAWGSAIPLDPGAHLVTVTAPSHTAWSTDVAIGEDGTAVDVDIPVLTPVQPKAFPKPAVHAALVVDEKPKSTTQRTLGIAVIGLGVAGLATGSIFGVIAKSKNDDALANHCGGGSLCDAQGLTLTNEARSSATIATISFSAGGAALLSGVVLLLTAPKSSLSRAAVRVAPSLSARSAGLSLGGTW